MRCRVRLDYQCDLLMLCLGSYSLKQEKLDIGQIQERILQNSISNPMLWTAVVFVLRFSASSGFVAPLSAGPFPLRTAPLALRLHLLSNCRHSSQPCRKPASHFMHLSGNLLLWFYMLFLSWEHIDLDHDISDSVSHTLDFQVHARDTRNLL